MHHHSTKQRLAALRRRFGIKLTPPKWARERSQRFKEAALAAKAETAAAMRTGGEARRFVASLTPAPGLDRTPAPFRQIVEALTPAPGVFFATAGGPGDDGDAPTTVAQAPYPSNHLSATDAARSRPGGGGGGGSSGD